MGEEQPKPRPTKQQRELKELRAEADTLRHELEEAKETLNAIQEGTVDAVVVNTPDGDRIFTLEGAEHPYQIGRASCRGRV